MSLAGGSVIRCRCPPTRVGPRDSGGAFFVSFASPGAACCSPGSLAARAAASEPPHTVLRAASQSPPALLRAADAREFRISIKCDSDQGCGWVMTAYFQLKFGLFHQVM